MAAFFRKQNSPRNKPGRAILFGVILVFALLAACAVMAVNWPEASGDTMLKKGKLVVDASHASDGYIEARCNKKSKHRMKLRLTYNKTVYTYDLNNVGDYEIFPLQSGSGSYTVALYENAGGKKYTEQGKVKVKVEMADEEAAFLVPNKFVLYTPDSEAVKMSDALCEGLSSEAEKFDAVCAFMKSNFIYDFIKAVTVKAGTLPGVDECFEKKKGICQDLSAIAVCMLRVQGIHARVVVGYADKNYHAWVTALVDGEERFFDPTVAVNGLGKVESYTQETVY